MKVQKIQALRPWQRSYIHNSHRTSGEIGFHRNGTELDIWIRVNGKPCWYSVHAAALLEFLKEHEEWGDPTSWVVLPAASDDNTEEGPTKVDRYFAEVDLIRKEIWGE